MQCVHQFSSKFRRKSTRLWHLIYITTSLPGSILSICRSIFSSNFQKEFVSGRGGLVFQVGKFCQISSELWSLVLLYF